MSNGTARDISYIITTRHTIKWANNKIYVDGDYVEDFAKTATAGAFTLYGAGKYYSDIRIFSFKAWDANGTLIREMYPCYRKSDNALGFYDIVTQTFYTGTGTGSFIAGNNV